MKLTLRLLLCTLCVLPLARCGDGSDPQPGEGENDIVVTGAWAAATPPGASTAAAYLQITNTGETDDRLISARTDVAEWVEFHRHVSRDGMMAMEYLPEVAVPGGEAVIFEPNGKHLMLFGLRQPLQPGDVLELTLVLEVGGEVKLPAFVRDIRQ